MSRRPVAAVVIAAWLAGGLPGVGPFFRESAALAQEGHPLTGTWVGEWGTPPAARTRVTMVMTWDGAAVTGILNPGPDAVPLSRVDVDWASWTVRIEAAPKDASGAAAPATAEGRLEDIGSSRRKIVGTWTQGGTRGDFVLTRE